MVRGLRSRSRILRPRHHHRVIGNQKIEHGQEGSVVHDHGTRILGKHESPVTINVFGNIETSVAKRSAKPWNWATFDSCATGQNLVPWFVEPIITANVISMSLQGIGLYQT